MTTEKGNGLQKSKESLIEESQESSFPNHNDENQGYSYILWYYVLSNIVYLLHLKRSFFLSIQLIVFFFNITDFNLIITAGALMAHFFAV